MMAGRRFGGFYGGWDFHLKWGLGSLIIAVVLYYGHAWEVFWWGSFYWCRYIVFSGIFLGGVLDRRGGVCRGRVSVMCIYCGSVLKSLPVRVPYYIIHMYLCKVKFTIALLSCLLWGRGRFSVCSLFLRVVFCIICNFCHSPFGVVKSLTALGCKSDCNWDTGSGINKDRVEKGQNSASQSTVLVFLQPRRTIQHDNLKCFNMNHFLKVRLILIGAFTRCILYV